jgi:hypothetical protein
MQSAYSEHVHVLTEEKRRGPKRPPKRSRKENLIAVTILRGDPDFSRFILRKREGSRYACKDRLPTLACLR